MHGVVVRTARHERQHARLAHAVLVERERREIIVRCEGKSRGTQRIRMRSRRPSMFGASPSHAAHQSPPHRHNTHAGASAARCRLATRITRNKSSQQSSQLTPYQHLQLDLRKCNAGAAAARTTTRRWEQSNSQTVVATQQHPPPTGRHCRQRPLDRAVAAGQRPRKDGGCEHGRPHATARRAAC